MSESPARRTARATKAGRAALHAAAQDGRERPIRSVVMEDVDPTNGAVLSWMRCVVDDVLLPLHAAYPIPSASFGG